MQARVQKANSAHHYMGDLQGQELEKQRRAAQLKEDDRNFASLEQAQQAKQEAGRKQFFDKMNAYQLANDMKAQHYSNFMTGKDLATLSALDEQRYMRALQDKEAADRKRDELNGINKQNIQQSNLAELRK